MIQHARYVVVASLLAVSASLSSQSTFVNTLLPQPSTVRAVDGNGIQLAPSFSVFVKDAASVPLHQAAERTIVQLQNHTGILVQQRFADTESAATLVVDATNTTQPMPVLGVDESYTLDVTNGHGTLHAATLIGAYRGLETLQQLVQPTANGFIIPAVHIEDSPRFPWRGLMLDSGRHFLSVATVLRTIDGMAAVKLNVLHLHISENQGFRLESKVFPKLTQVGSEGEFYTQEQMRGIIAYAAARGIRVVPEFDLPGHSTSLLVAYPELAAGKGPYHLEKSFGIHDATLDPTKESTYAFLDKFFGEMASLFPDEYMHIGGDESTGREWRENPAIAAYMKQHNYANPEALQAYFNKRLQAILKKHGKKIVGWDEILNPGLSSGFIIQNWHGQKFLFDSAKIGQQAIFSQPFYLDHHYTAAQMYAADPLPEGNDLTAAQQKLVLGGEACMWSEQVTDDTVDSHIWMRAAAVAERLWSPQHLRDTADMYRRLDAESLRLDAIGIQHIVGPQRMQRQWFNGMLTPEAEVLISVLQPVDFGQRSQRQHNTRNTPMTFLADSLAFDPPMQYTFAKTMQDFLHGDQSTRERSGFILQNIFSWWARTDALDQQVAQHPRLAEVKERRAQLIELGKLGVQMVQFANTKKKLSPEDATKADALLKQAAKPNSELVEFVVIAPMQELLTTVR